jgi:hypothetical protein
MGDGAWQLGQVTVTPMAMGVVVRRSGLSISHPHSRTTVIIMRGSGKGPVSGTGRGHGWSLAVTFPGGVHFPWGELGFVITGDGQAGMPAETASERVVVRAAGIAEQVLLGGLIGTAE